MSGFVLADGRHHCRLCSEPMADVSPHLHTVMALDKCPQADRAALIAEREGVSIEAARDWLRHHVDAACPERIGRCNACDGALRTWVATWCPHCRRNDVGAYLALPRETEPGLRPLPRTGAGRPAD